MTYADACFRLASRDPEAFRVIVETFEGARPKDRSDHGYYSRFVGNIEGNLYVMRAARGAAKKNRPAEDDIEESTRRAPL